MELKKQIIHKNVTPSWDITMDGVFAHQHGRPSLPSHHHWLANEFSHDGWSLHTSLTECIQNNERERENFH